MTIIWPIQPPVRIPGGLAATVERERTQNGDYPPEWPGVAWLVKTIAAWRCERCAHEHDRDPRTGFVLTVHHLDGEKWNLQHWNLAALCQKCHLRIQNRVNFKQDWPFEHRPWMARHVIDYKEWAVTVPCGCDGGLDYSRACDAVPDPRTGEPSPRGPEPCEDCGGTGHLPLLSLNGIEDRDYSKEWANA